MVVADAMVAALEPWMQRQGRLAFVNSDGSTWRMIHSAILCGWENRSLATGLANLLTGGVRRSVAKI